MNLCKCCFFILSFVASYVDSDFEIYKGKKLYFNSCQCGEAVSVGYGFFSLNIKYSILTKNSKYLVKWQQNLGSKKFSQCFFEFLLLKQNLQSDNLWF